jgi:alkylation response protein AidB-like acyl-CoA dehydrogenase
MSVWDEAQGLNEEHKAFRAFVREFAREHVSPIADEIDQTETIPAETIAAFASAGLSQLAVPAVWGGSDGDLRAICIAKEEVSRAGSSALAMLCGQNKTLVAPLLKFGTDEQREALLPALSEGAIVSLCITEPSAGSHPMEMRTRAVRDGTDWVLNGQKALISWGELAKFAVVLAKTHAADGESISAFIVDTAADGYIVLRHNKKMGQRGVPNVDLLIENLRVPANRMLGSVGRGLETALGMLHLNRPTMGALAIGTAQASMDHAISFLTERKQGGKSLTSHQGLRWMLADMAVELSSARALLYECARQIDEGTDLTEISTFASMVKIKATEVGFDVTNKALQLLGGAGYLSDYPIERYLRDVRVGTLYEGTSEIQRNTIARAILNPKGESVRA